MALQPLICVDDVEASSLWYQRLFGFTSGHGGRNYERLNDAQGRLVLQLHRWDVEHDHGPLGDPEQRPRGNGLLLWFELPDYAEVLARVAAMGVDITRADHASENGNRECWLRDLNGYALVLCSPWPT